MPEIEIADILSLHAEALNQGRVLADPLTQLGSAVERSQTAELLGLAQKVKTVLGRPAPRPAFIAELKAQLLHAHRQVTQASPPAADRRTLWIGLGVSLAIGSLLTAILAILGWRMSRHTVTKPHAAH